MRRALLQITFAICLAIAFTPNSSAQIFFGAGNQNEDWVAMWAFNGRSEQQVREQLTGQYETKISMLDRLCDLDETQHAKLDRSARADVSRFFREVTKIRKQVKDSGLNPNNNQDMNKMWQIISPLAQKMQQGVFGKDSLFQKVLRGTLNADQNKIYADELKRLQERRFKTITRINVAELEGSMPLIGDQRDKLLAILDKQTLPDFKENRHFEAYAGYLKLLLAKRKDPKLGGFLDKQQMAVIDQYCDRYRGWEGILRP